jgi:hypothetical protein
MLSKFRQELCDQMKVNVVLTETSEKVMREEQTYDLKSVFFKTKVLPGLKKKMPEPFVLAINPEKKNDDFL